MNNLSGVSTKVNETKPDPFSTLGPKMAHRSHCWQPSGAGKCGAALTAGPALPPWQLWLTLVSFSVNEGSWPGDDLPLTHSGSSHDSMLTTEECTGKKEI